MPVEVRPAMASSETASPETAGRAPTILVIDDEPAFAASLADILAAKGYEVLVAGTGKEGIRMARDTAIDLALVDLRLPDVSGVDVLARISETSPATKVVILTGNASLDTAMRALNTGAFGYVEKPYDIDRLFLLIERALARRGRRDAASRAVELAGLLEQASVPMFAYSPDSGDISYANAALARLFGFPEPDRTAFSLPLLFRHAAQGLLADHLVSLKQHGRATHDLPQGVRAEGERWFELTSSLVTQQPSLAFGVLTDVSARRRTHSESVQARQYFEAVFENIAAGVAIIDSNYVIRQANAAFSRFYRSTAEQLVGRRCHEVIHTRLAPCGTQGDVCPITNCLAAGTAVSVQHKHCDADGRLRFHEVTMAPLHDESGTIVSFVAIFADFTEIKRAQEESEAKSRELQRLNQELTVQRAQLATQAAELEQANAELLRLGAAKDDFISLVSHELRTPLTAISEGISLVADGSLGALNQRQSRFLDVAHRNCLRLGELINDLLDLSKIEAGKMDVRPDCFDLVTVARDVVESFLPLAGDKGLALEARADPASIHVYADERLVRRTLTNLVSNAVKFTDHGGISLVLTRPAGDHAVVAVTDTGIGIPVSEQSRVFDRFHQVQTQDRNRPAGTGLGLALTRQMVEMNSGRIDFESREDSGTTFRFTLPLDSTEARVACELARTGTGVATRAVLIRIANPEDIARRCGAAGVSDALATIESLVSHSRVHPVSSIVLPATAEFMVLLNGSSPSVGDCLAEFRSLLSGATFVLRDQVTPVRLTCAARRLPDSADASALLEQMRMEAQSA